MSYLQLKHVCINCDAHFVVCTAFPENFKLNYTHCPQCGRAGTSIRHTASVEGEVEDMVPGDSPFEGVGNKVKASYFEDGDPKEFLLPDKDND